ncbi:hypothetical protein GCM10011374_40130 [Kocuria dechangensis]|uniref:Uncharacterized protein n=1 Tax=Kocuria dechangensis TaxID=1176249 RepID=A0A917M1A7_9MICC|nr:hypothetical protein GCM10011374_40130 [Kocuria dechangensis]
MRNQAHGAVPRLPDTGTLLNAFVSRFQENAVNLPGAAGPGAVYKEALRHVCGVIRRAKRPSFRVSSRQPPYLRETMCAVVNGNLRR